MALMGWIIGLPYRLEVDAPHRSLNWLLGREELAGMGEHCSHQMACLRTLCWLHTCFLHQQPGLHWAALLWALSPVPAHPSLCLFLPEGQMSLMML